METPPGTLGHLGAWPRRARPTAPDSLHGIGVLDVLEHDPRPTLVVKRNELDLGSLNGLVTAYWNPAMAVAHAGSLLVTLLGPGGGANGAAKAACHADLAAFQNWMSTCLGTNQHFLFARYTWTKVELMESRWTVVSGIRSDTPAGSPGWKSSRIGEATFDWTHEDPPSNTSAHLRWARSINWAQTSLGPMSLWPSQLRSFANLVFMDPRPAVLFFGPDLTMLYNETYIDLLGNTHPCLGLSAHLALNSVWAEYFEPLIAKNMLGEAVEKTDYYVSLSRNGFLEETYFSFRLMPVLDSEGLTVGHYQTLLESTKNVTAHRRSQTLLELSEEVSCAKDTDSYWALTTEILSRNGKDIPFALLYSAQLSESAASTSAPSFVDGQQCTLRGSLGGSTAGPAHLDFQGDQGFTPYLRQALLARKPITVALEEGWPAAMLVQDVQWQGFGDPCRAAAVCPLLPIASTNHVLGFAVLGLNPPAAERAMASSEAAKHELKRQLVNTQREAERNASKFQRFSERSDVGIFIIRKEDGVYTYRNEAWLTILGPSMDRDMELGDAWGALIDDEYAPVGKAKFEALLETKQHQSFELRLKRSWDTNAQSYGSYSPEQQQPMWVLCSIFPELENEEVLEIVGCITDISRQKWSEKLQATEATLAQESRKQLEDFIDTTSHEMRNPLSAIIQCADSIVSLGVGVSDSPNMSERMQDSAESADIILQCAKHMKTIVDDVLTMSKMQSGLFVMTPAEVQLGSIAKDAVRMFEGEAKASGIDLMLDFEDSHTHLEDRKVSLDPTRVMQVLINLVTNGIKFTRLESTRHIVVSLGLSWTRPLQVVDQVHGTMPFVSVSETSESDKSLQSDWEKGKEVYPIFSVRDTGRGMSEAEHALLFARFSQTTPRTHIDYGGSGLGLFISRRLAEMHGGAIGFASKAGVGSTFSFYVKSRMVPEPQARRPQARAPLDHRTGAQASMPLRPAQRRPASDATGPTTHVLLVEDNLVNQRVLAKQLRSRGMRVAVANHGGEALAYLRRSRYCRAGDAAAPALSLVLMDWEMPVMDGLACVRAIRQLQREGVVHGHVPVIGITANVRAEQIRDALEAGMDDVISKPFRITELCGCMEKTLRSTAVHEPAAVPGGAVDGSHDAQEIGPTQHMGTTHARADSQRE